MSKYFLRHSVAVIAYFSELRSVLIKAPMFITIFAKWTGT